MKRSYFDRVLLCLLLGLCAPLLGHCGGAADLGTETGNPPRVDERKLHLVEAAGGVQLIGQAGAVSPGGATLRVENQRTGESVETTVAADGSVDVIVPGSLEDDYSITVSSGGRSVTARVSGAASGGAGGAGGGAAGAGGAGAGGAGLASLSCDALANTLSEGLAAGFATADTTCEVDSDCMRAYWGVSCYHDCGSSLVASAGESEARDQLDREMAPVCVEFVSRCGPQPAGLCASPSDAPECRNGTCQGFETSSLACGELSTEAGSRVRELVDRADRTCVIDDDCELMTYDVSCFADCGGYVSVAQTAVTNLVQAIRGVQSDICRPFAERQCDSPPIPPCVPPPLGEEAPTCNAGRCESAFIE